MDKRKGIINVAVSIGFKIVIMVVGIISRRFVIQYLGNDINGLNSLYISLLDILSVAELGVGSAITFCMYKPIVEGDDNKVSALYGLFTRLYLIIGGIILVAGCAIMPALPYLAKDYNTDVNLYLTFALMLISVVLSYVFSSKTSLINAYKNNYLTTTISSVGMIAQHVAQIVVVLFTKSFVGFLICRICAMLLQWGATEFFARRKHKAIIVNKQKLDADTKKEVTKNIKAMFMHKIGGVLVNTADSVIISAFIGVAILGKYSNYTIIVTTMVGVISLFFSPLTSVIGHSFVEENTEQSKKYFNFFYTFNFILGLVFFLGYYAVIDNLVTLLFGNNLEMSKSVSFIIAPNYFIQFMRQATMTFRDATGTFYYDRWKPIVEGIFNIGLSIGLVYLFKFLWGDEFAVVGVIVATIITNLFICHVVEPYVLYKHAFNCSPKGYYIRNYVHIAIFIGLLFALHFSMIKSDNQWVELFANAGISLGYSLSFSAIAILLNKDFKHYIKVLFDKVFKRRKAVEVAGKNGAAMESNENAKNDAVIIAQDSSGEVKDNNSEVVNDNENMSTLDSDNAEVAATDKRNINDYGVNEKEAS